LNISETTQDRHAVTIDH